MRHHLFAPSSGTRFCVWEIARAWLGITKAERGARYCISAANFGASFISRVAAIWEGETRKLIRGRIYHPAWKSKQSRGAVHHSGLWHHRQPASAELAEWSPKKGKTGPTGQENLCVLLDLWPWGSFPNGPRVSRTLDVPEKQGDPWERECIRDLFVILLMFFPFHQPRATGRIRGGVMWLILSRERETKLWLPGGSVKKQCAFHVSFFLSRGLEWAQNWECIYPTIGDMIFWTEVKQWCT